MTYKGRGEKLVQSQSERGLQKRINDKSKENPHGGEERNL